MAQRDNESAIIILLGKKMGYKKILSRVTSSLHFELYVVVNFLTFSHDFKMLYNELTFMY